MGEMVNRIKTDKTAKTGFTLIELIIVIVILGILAATALPKFADLSSQARTAANRGISGSFGSAINVAKAQFLAQGQPATITFGGTVLGMNTDTAVGGFGFPCGTAACTDATASTTASCQNIINGILTNPPPLGTPCTAASTAGCYTVTAPAASQCQYTRFDDSTGNTNFIYDYSAGTVTSSP